MRREPTLPLMNSMARFDAAARRSARAALLGVAALALAVGAQSARVLAQSSGNAFPQDALQKRDQEFEALRAQQRKALDVEAKLKSEIAAIGDDRRKLNQQLIDTAARVRDVEGRIAATEDRLRPLDEEDSAIRRSLDGRRAVIGEVLAAMQRIGRRPPPAILIRPEDALESVRTAMMLGAVIPSMRSEAEALAQDLGEMVKVRRGIAEERDRLARDLAALSDGRRRMTLLIDERQKNLADKEKALETERQRVAALAGQANDLRDLIANLERGLDSATRAARELARAKLEPQAAPVDTRQRLAALNDPGRLGPAIAFEAARKLLPLPVNGVRIRDYGSPDGLGGAERGLTLATRAGAQVTAPCDGWVVYAGPFRSYGQLLILDAGGGYHVLLAGMERISVEIGQLVLTGEPVAEMGGGVRAATILATGSKQPVLYVEFRKDGTPVDPGPWWASGEGEKVRG